MMLTAKTLAMMHAEMILQIAPGQKYVADLASTFHC